MIKRIKKRYVLIIWLVLYATISLFKYFQIKTLIFNKYGKVSNKFYTTKYMNESIIIDGAILVIGFPVLLLTGGWNFTKWAYSDVKFNKNQKLTTYIELKSPFLDNKFQITMRGGKIVSDTFSTVLSTDVKFQHLYSEWVKKEVGIEDENVEIDVKCDKIFFENISKYDSNEDIFTNSSGRLVSINIKDAKTNNYISLDETFLSFEKKYISKFYKNNILCDYDFIIVGENGNNNLCYKVKDYFNKYSNEHYRTREGYIYSDGIKKQKNCEVFSMINENNEYMNINTVDFNNKTYKYIIYDVLFKKNAPINIFNLSNDVVNNKEFVSNPNINILTNDRLLNKTDYNDGYILVEKIIELEQGYRRYKYEIELNEIHFSGNGKELMNCNTQNKIKCVFKDIFGAGNDNNYIIYKLNENDNWESIFQKTISPNGKYVEINDYIFKNEKPTYDFFIEIENKLIEYYDNIK